MKPKESYEYLLILNAELENIRFSSFHLDVRRALLEGDNLETVGIVRSRSF
jgi:hypothetical protein